MTLYRLHAPLNVKGGCILPKHSVNTLKMVKDATIAILLQKDLVSPAETPPLAIIPGYESIGAALEAYNIITVADFIVMLEDNPADLVAILETEYPTLERYRDDLETNWLSIPQKRG